MRRTGDHLSKSVWIIAALALLGAALVLYASQKYGIGLAPDAVGYIQVAREILSGQGISSAFTLQPPLYPVALAAVGALTRSDPLDAAVWFNALLFAGAIFCAGVLCVRHLPNFHALAVLGAFGVLCARPLVNVAVTAYSEMLFIFLIGVAFLGMSFYFEKRNWKWLAIAILATALACLTRYVGVALIASSALAIVWVLRAERGRAFFVAALFAALSALPLSLWALRNVMVSGEPFGERAASRVSFIENINLTVETFASWFVPNAWEWVFWLGLIVVCGALLFRVLARRSDQNAHSSLAPYFLFVVIFTALLIFSATTTALNRINTRLLSPLFIPALLLFVIMFDRVLNPLRARRGNARGGNAWGGNARGGNAAASVPYVALLVIAALFIFPIQTNVPRITRAAEQGAGGYNTTRWRTNETVAYVTQHRAEMRGTIYSNGPDALYILADVNAQSIPPKFQYASNEPAQDANTLRGAYPPEPATLIWLDQIEREDFLFTFEELNGFTNLTPIAKLRDGAVYRMEKR